MAEKRDRDTRRETRLLLLVVAVSLAVLVLLAQWRFPATDMTVAPPSAAPLAGLAARATFDEMASTLADMLGRVSPSLMVVRLSAAPVDRNERPGRGRSSVTVRPASAIHRGIALRVAPGIGLLHLPQGVHPFSAGDEETALEVVARDEARELALVRLADTGSNTDLLAGGLRTFTGLSFAAVIEATPTAPTVRPVFIGRADPVLDARWSHPLYVIGPVPDLVEGSFVFSVGGRLIGLAEPGPEGLVIVPPAALETVVTSLLPGR